MAFVVDVIITLDCILKTTKKRKQCSDSQIEQEASKLSIPHCVLQGIPTCLFPAYAFLQRVGYMQFEFCGCGKRRQPLLLSQGSPLR